MEISECHKSYALDCYIEVRWDEMKDVTVFARNFRGFRQVEIALNQISFLVGDNSSGKSSILYLVDSVLRNDLTSAPRLNEGLGVGAFDYFSPYFKNADVTFGYSTREHGDLFAKIVTVRRTKNNLAAVTSCTYLASGKALTLKKWGKKTKTRIITATDSETPNQLLKLHDDDQSFRIAEALPGTIDLSDLSAVFYLMDREKEGISDEFLNAILAGRTPDSTIVSPLRAPPGKFYESNRRMSTKGSHFAIMWRDMLGWRKTKGFDIVSSFGRDSKLFDELLVESVAKTMPDSPLVVSIKKNRQTFFLNQVGVGVSQVAPILVDCLFAIRDGSARYVLLQQPELHLHPIAQAAMGTMFFRMSTIGLRGVLETHSSFLIDRFRAELRDADSPNEVLPVSAGQAPACSIYFCVNSESGNDVVKIDIDRSGALIGAPDLFHQFFVDELMRTMF